jgi:hypothetical protein
VAAGHKFVLLCRIAVNNKFDQVVANARVIQQRVAFG